MQCQLISLHQFVFTLLATNMHCLDSGRGIDMVVAAIQSYTNEIDRLVCLSIDAHLLETLTF